MSGWRSVQIADVGRVVTGKTPPSAEPELFVGCIPFITPSDMADDCRHIATERSVSRKWDPKFRQLLPQRSVCVVCIGATIGKICMTSEPSHTNQQLNSIIVDHDRFDPFFVYYSLRTKVSELKAHAAGAATPIINKSTFSEIVLDAPCLGAQRRIGEILGAYDDLIEVNRRRVKLLEEMARGLFEEWFVRFRFPGHETIPLLDTSNGKLPEGWRYVGLHDVTEIAFGFPFVSNLFSKEKAGSRVIRIRDVPDGVTSTWTSESFENRYAVVNGDILIGMDGIFHMAFWVGGDAALNQRVTRLRPIDGYSKGFVFQSTYPKIKYYEATISGTTVAHLGAKHLNEIRILVADTKTQKAADTFFSAIDEEFLNLRVANERLAASRDLLLPRLISGQLSVEAAEQQLAAE